MEVANWLAVLAQTIVDIASVTGRGVWEGVGILLQRVMPAAHVDKVSLIMKVLLLGQWLITMEK